MKLLESVLEDTSDLLLSFGELSDTTLFWETRKMSSLAQR